MIAPVDHGRWRYPCFVLVPVATTTRDSPISNQNILSSSHSVSHSPTFLFSWCFSSIGDPVADEAHIRSRLTIVSFGIPRTLDHCAIATSLQTLVQLILPPAVKLESSSGRHVSRESIAPHPEACKLSPQTSPPKALAEPPKVTVTVTMKGCASSAPTPSTSAGLISGMDMCS